MTDSTQLRNQELRRREKRMRTHDRRSVTDGISRRVSNG